MAYVHGQSPEALRRTRQEAAKAESELRSATITLKGLRTRLETTKQEREAVSRQIAQERRKLNAEKQIRAEARERVAAVIAQAHEDAGRMLLEAERDAALIREKAVEQARALRDRHYTTGRDREWDEFRARVAALKEAS